MNRQASDLLSALALAAFLFMVFVVCASAGATAPRRMRVTVRPPEPAGWWCSEEWRRLAGGGIGYERICFPPGKG